MLGSSSPCRARLYRLVVTRNRVFACLRMCACVYVCVHTHLWLRVRVCVCVCNVQILLNITHPNEGLILMVIHTYSMASWPWTSTAKRSFQVGGI
jgi:hypothetical protein